MSSLEKKIKASLNLEKCDLVLKNATFINVFTQSLDKGDIGICDDIIIGIGTYEGNTEIDCTNKVVSPGFIDSHVHIESSMVTPKLYGSLALKNGVTTVIADPHEIANIQGKNGISFMINDSNNTDLDAYFMMPSCVPAINFEENGYTLKSSDLKEFIDNSKVLGLGEVMDVSSVVSRDSSMMDKLNSFSNKYIDGHAPNLKGENLNGYITAGVKTDHECSTLEDALEKIRKGMYVIIREGSAAKNLEGLLPAINDKNYHRFLFCSDDRHLEDLIEEGSINHAIKLSIKLGLDPIKAYTIGTYNGYCCYGLKDKGAIAPGYKADLVILNDIKEVDILKVIKNGLLQDFAITKDPSQNNDNSINLNKITENIFAIDNINKFINVIGVKPGSLETNSLVETFNNEEEFKKSIKEKDILKLSVIERHKNTGHYSLCFIKGLGLKNCSIAQSISHDSHNIIVVGDDDKDMALAVNTLIDIKGGIVIVSRGEVLDSLSLEIGGIMTNNDSLFVYEKLKSLNTIIKKHGLNPGFDAFITLSFMALPVIPELKLTTKGLFHYGKFSLIPLTFD